MKKIGIIDYDAGNLFSITNSLKYLKINFIISDKNEELEKCSHLILPGVGSFLPAMNSLKKKGLDKFIKQSVFKNKPILGICLGMQLLFSKSSEFGNNIGLNLIKGKVNKIRSNKIKIPIVGWFKFQGLNKNIFSHHNGKYVYLVHSYECLPDNKKIIIGTYEPTSGKKIICAIQQNNIFAVQFHPEKSHYAGIKLLKIFYNYEN